ncbi:hypothetical protein FBEOM_6607 [Fusarium beomiforme]|uniref:F-box domain-containing protein n=1 Tax=Fusarium beomiforme TaxID=44412 RepID=A0A9P5AIT0_9HYPO|nr:hypothetical protein FBEOM_6607 [Fusarium beomiforme]
MAEQPTACPLATMPTEVLCMIGDNLSHHEIRNTTLVSKRLRQLFLPRICKQLKFSGNMEQLENGFHFYFAAETTPFRDVVHRHTRYVTFNTKSFDTIDHMRAWFINSQISVLQIGKFLIDTPNLQHVTFNTRLEESQESVIFQHLTKGGPRWPSFRTLTFGSPTDDAWLIGTIINKVGLGSLEAISGGFQMFLVDPKILNFGCANVTSLCLKKQYNTRGLLWDELSLEILDDDLLEQLKKLFPELESLILDEGIQDYSVRNVTLLDSELLYLMIDEAVYKLREMPRLRRFAFTLDTDRLEPCAINELEEDFLLMLSDEIIQDYEVNGQDGFYNLLIRYLFICLPNLEELCVTSRHPVCYHGRVTSGGMIVSRQSLDDPDMKYTFPNAII